MVIIFSVPTALSILPQGGGISYKQLIEGEKFELVQR
jgi:hypothetical protein